MKKRDLEKVMKKFGWWRERHGKRHDVWTNGNLKEAVPRHSELDEALAKSIIKKVSENKGKAG